VALWCEHCDRPVEGVVCEVCHQSVETPEREPLPWKWRFFVVATVVYVGYRIYQLIHWLAH